MSFDMEFAKNVLKVRRDYGTIDTTLGEALDEIERLRKEPKDPPCGMDNPCLALDMKRKDYRAACDEVDRLRREIHDRNAKIAGLNMVVANLKEGTEIGCTCSVELELANAELARLRDKRRFDAACAALTGIRARKDSLDATVEQIAAWAWFDADALMAAMGVTK
jgi:hypothetical protein